MSYEAVQTTDPPKKRRGPGRPRTWTDQQLCDAAQGGRRSIAEVIELLGLQPSGTARDRLREHADRLGLTFANGYKHRRRRPTGRRNR